MTRTLIAAVMLLSAASFAQPEPSYEPGPPGAYEPGPGFERHGARFEQRIIERITQALALDQAGAQKVKSILDATAGQRKPLHQQLKASFMTIRAAANGDPNALGQLDSAIAQGQAARQQLQQLQQQTFDSLVQLLGLNGQRKAKLLMAFLPRRGMGRGHRPGGF